MFLFFSEQPSCGILFKYQTVIIIIIIIRVEILGSNKLGSLIYNKLVHAHFNTAHDILF